MMIHVIGSGVVAFRVQRMLGGERVLMHPPRQRSFGAEPGDIAVIAHGGLHTAQAAVLLERGVSVVSSSDQSHDIAGLQALAALAAARNVTLIVGAATAPGLSGLLARQMSMSFGAVDEIHIGLHGTAGQDCARRHHQALSGRAVTWHDGGWREWVGGSGRDLLWFPEPVGAHDCYRARSVDPELLHGSFPEAQRISYRRSARRRDRLTARLPMLAPPPSEGSIGGLRVELRGSNPDGTRRTDITGVAELIGTATAATAAAFTDLIVTGRLEPGVFVTASSALPTVEILRRVERYGVRLQEFTGIAQRK